MPWEPIQPLALAVDDRPSGTPRPDRLYRPPVSHHVHMLTRRYPHFGTALFIIIFIIFHWLLCRVCHYVFMCLAPSFLPSRGGAVMRIR